MQQNTVQMLALLLETFIKDIVDGLRKDTDSRTTHAEAEARDDPKGSAVESESGLGARTKNVRFRSKSIITNLRLSTKENLSTWEEEGYERVPSVFPGAEEMFGSLSAAFKGSENLLSSHAPDEQHLSASSASLNFGGDGDHYFLITKKKEIDEEKNESGVVDVVLSDTYEDETAGKDGYECLTTNTNEASSTGAPRYLWVKNGVKHRICDVVVQVIPLEEREKDAHVDQASERLRQLLRRQGFQDVIGDLNSGNGKFSIFLFVKYETDERARLPDRNRTVRLSSIQQRTLCRISDRINESKWDIQGRMLKTLSECDRGVVQTLVNDKEMLKMRKDAARALFPEENTAEVVCASGLMLACQLFVECVFAYFEKDAGGIKSQKRALLEFLCRRRNIEVQWRQHLINIRSVDTPDAKYRELISTAGKDDLVKMDLLLVVLRGVPFWSFQATCHDRFGVSVCDTVHTKTVADTKKYSRPSYTMQLAAAVMETIQALLDEQWDIDYIIQHAQRFLGNSATRQKNMTIKQAKCSEQKDSQGEDVWTCESRFSEPSKGAVQLMRSEDLMDVCKRCHSLFSLTLSSFEEKWITGKQLADLVNFASSLALDSVCGTKSSPVCSSSRIRNAGLQILVSRLQQKNLDSISHIDDKWPSLCKHFSKAELRSVVRLFGVSWNPFVKSSLSEIENEAVMSYSALADKCQTFPVFQLFLANCTFFQQEFHVANIKVLLLSCRGRSEKTFGEILCQWKDLNPDHVLFPCKFAAVSSLVATLRSKMEESSNLLVGIRYLDINKIVQDALCFKLMRYIQKSPNSGRTITVLTLSDVLCWLRNWWMDTKHLPAKYSANLEHFFLRLPEKLKDESPEEWIDAMDEEALDHKIGSSEVDMTNLERINSSFESFVVKPSEKESLLEAKCLVTEGPTYFPLGSVYVDARPIFEKLGDRSRSYFPLSLSVVVREDKNSYLVPASISIADFILVSQLRIGLQSLLSKRATLSTDLLGGWKKTDVFELERLLKTESESMHEDEDDDASGSEEADASSRSDHTDEEEPSSGRKWSASANDSEESSTSSCNSAPGDARSLTVICGIKKRKEAHSTDVISGADPITKRLEVKGESVEELRRKRRVTLITGLSIDGEKAPSKKSRYEKNYFPG
eukprot:gb/GECG01006693.1/.p1 GENE.gb/GECG01006693.1/~~gb/GECG01006693.1/.p1  ORF type:complete len:1144 (+),score=157.03 gb/GECG01006693.1/:1-3432(+)